jgi:hypothetical protein
MTSLRQAIEALQPIEGGWRGTVPDNWLQGRTAYGGFSAALALHAAQMSDTDLPPLRSAQVAFIGPLSGDITIRATRLRRGRNAAFVQADVESAAGLGLRATFVFMGPIASRVDHHTGTAPAFAVPDADTATYRGHSAVAFSRNFDLLDRRDDSVGPAEWLRWVRLADRDGLDQMVELIAVADCLPPSALKLLGGPAPSDARRLVAAARDDRLCPRRQFEPVDGDLERAGPADRRTDAERRDLRLTAASGRPRANVTCTIQIATVYPSPDKASRQPTVITGTFDGDQPRPTGDTRCARPCSRWR